MERNRRELKIRIGTRKSKLALWQAEYVAEKLNAGGVDTELVLMETKGDKVLDVSIAKIGSKGVFTEELEQQLVSGSIDIAVHSAKDLQSKLPDGFRIVAFTEREKINDVIVSSQPIDLEEGVVLGTSSTRRVALLRHFYPKVKTVEVRGNLQTRVRKMEEGICDGLVLAYAGVHRMGYDDMIRVELSKDEFIPAVGQGSVAVEAHLNLTDEKTEIIRELVNDAPTEDRLIAERAFLAKLEGGCSIPVFALAERKDDMMTVVGGIVSLDGSERIVKKMSGKDPIILGQMLANEVLSAGGDRILTSIRKAL